MTKRTHAMAMQTKQQIIDAALEVFSEKGFEKTSLSDVARRANVTRGAIYWHFEDKGALLCELCVSIAHQKKFTEHLIAASRDTEVDPLGCLKKWMIIHSQDSSIQLFTSSICSVTNSVMYNSQNKDSEKVKERFLNLMNNRLFYVKEALKNAIAHRQLPNNCDIDLIAEFIHTFLIGQYHAVRENINNKVNEHFKLLVDNLFKIFPNLVTEQKVYNTNYEPYYK